MEDFALGELRLLPADFWNLTWSEYLRRARGYHREQVNEWRRTRWQTTQLINIQLPKGDKIDPEDLLMLPGDAPPALPEVLSDEEYAHILTLDSDLNIVA